MHWLFQFVTYLGITLALTANHTLAVDSSWQLQQEKAGISVSTRPVEESPYHEVKGTVLIDAPVTRVAELMGDGDGCARWRAMCESSVIIEQVSDNERYVYLVLDLPWPVKDRDLVIHSMTSVDPQTFTATVDLQTDSSRHPASDYIRAESRGQFILRAQGTEKTEFTMIMHTDLGGDLPAGAINGRLVDSTYDDLNRLQALAEG